MHNKRLALIWITALALGSIPGALYAQGITGPGSTFSGPLAGDVTGTQSATVVGAINGTSLAGLATGIVKNTTATGVPSIAVAGVDYPGLPNFATTPGDMACAMAGDTTINTLTITAATNASPPVLTVSASPITAGYYVGSPVTVSGVNPSNYNGTAYTVTALDATHLTLSGSAPGVSYTSGGTASMTCGNQVTDATSTAYVFSGNYTVPANYFSTAGKTLGLSGQYVIYSPAASPAGLSIPLFYGATAVYNPAGIYSIITNSKYGGSIGWRMTSVAASTVVSQLAYVTVPNNSALNLQENTALQPLSLSASATAVGAKAQWAATGVASGTYTSGIAATGTVGQTCALTSFNNSSTATATVALTGTNTIAASTALVITSRGAAATAAPTTATAGNGTATCSGTATIATVLGGSPGNALMQHDFYATPF